MCVGEPAIASNDDLEPHNGLLFAGPGLDSPTHKWQEAAPGALKRSRAAIWSAGIGPRLSLQQRQTIKICFCNAGKLLTGS